MSVHGYSRRSEELDHAILVGGRARGMARDVARRIRAALSDAAVVDDRSSIPVGLRGLDPRNPVNRTAGGGVQLELPPRARVIGRYGERPGAAPYRVRTRTLIATLARFARDQAD